MREKILLIFGISLIITGYTALLSFILKPNYLAGIFWFFSIMVGIALLIYRWEKLNSQKEQATEDVK